MFREKISVTTDVAINNMPFAMLQAMLGDWASTFTEFSAQAGEKITGEDKKTPFKELDCYIDEAFAGATISDYLALHAAIRALLQEAKVTLGPVRGLDLRGLVPPRESLAPTNTLATGQAVTQENYLRQMWRATCISCSSSIPASLSGLLQEVAQLPYPSMSQLLGYAVLTLNRTLLQSQQANHPCKLKAAIRGNATNATRNQPTDNTNYTVAASAPYVNLVLPLEAQTRSRNHTKPGTVLVTNIHYSVAYQRSGLASMARAINYLHSAIPRSEAAWRQMQLGVELSRDDAVGAVSIGRLEELALTTNVLKVATKVEWDVTGLLGLGQRLDTLTTQQLEANSAVPTTNSEFSGKLLTEFDYKDGPAADQAAAQSPEMAFRVAFPQTKTAHRDIKGGVGSVRWEADYVAVRDGGRAAPPLRNGSVVHADVAWAFLVDGDVVEVFLKEDDIADDQLNPTCARKEKVANGECIAYQWLVVPECRRDIVRQEPLWARRGTHLCSRAHRCLQISGAGAEGGHLFAAPCKRRSVFQRHADVRMGARASVCWRCP